MGLNVPKTGVCQYRCFAGEAVGAGACAESLHSGAPRACGCPWVGRGALGLLVAAGPCSLRGPAAST